MLTNNLYICLVLSPENVICKWENNCRISKTNNTFSQSFIKRYIYRPGKWHTEPATCWSEPMISHYNAVIMRAMAYQITSLAIVYSTVYSGADQRNIKVPRHWPLCREFTGHRWIPRTQGRLRGKCSHLMTSSCVGLMNNSWIWNHAQNAL